ncbi:MAG TPA: VCBS repeat-containing protein [Myxococcales bacterium]|nr:VCBS repeat-containing protein [Myxococcales bacterium]
MRRAAWAVPVAAAFALAGCDFEGELKACAEAERCLVDGPVPIPRFPHNGAGLGSPFTVVSRGAPWMPRRPWLVYDTDGDPKWSYRVQLNKCDPGTDLAACPFLTSASDGIPNANGSSYALNTDLEIGKRYWWRVRACDTSAPGAPCAAWSAARYFDVGRPEALPNDFEANGTGDLAFADAHAGNLGKPEQVYLYAGSGAAGWPASATASELAVVAPSTMGDYTVVVAGAGDLDGDGTSDLAVSYRAIDPALQLSPVDVFLGGTMVSNGLGFARSLRLSARGGDFGAPLGRGGDLNGDGRSDLVVCQARQQRALVFFGTSAGLVDRPDGDAQLNLPFAGQLNPFCAFAALSDVNADGFDDVAVAGEGQLRVFPGTAIPGQWNGVDLQPPPGTRGFARTVAGGDFNGDGHGDLVASTDDGHAFLFLGSTRWFDPGGLPPPIMFDVPLGAVAPAGDVNNDGYADLVVGGGGAPVKVQLFLGQASGPPKPSAIYGDGGLPGYGISFAGAGDVTEDQYEDVAVGSARGVLLFRGNPSDSDQGTDPLLFSPPAGSEQFGRGVAGGYGY